MKFTTPLPLKREHDELGAKLAAMANLPGPVGSVARSLAAVVNSHFEKEEVFALPPLSLLSRVAFGDVIASMAAVTTMTDHLKAELPTLLAEHARITAALRSLAIAAQDANDFSSSRFSEGLLAHIQTEELVFYPAAILVGDCVREHFRRAIKPALPTDGGSRNTLSGPSIGSDY